MRVSTWRVRMSMRFAVCFWLSRQLDLGNPVLFFHVIRSCMRILR